MQFFVNHATEKDKAIKLLTLYRVFICKSRPCCDFNDQKLFGLKLANDVTLHIKVGNIFKSNFV